MIEHCRATLKLLAVSCLNKERHHATNEVNIAGETVIRNYNEPNGNKYIAVNDSCSFTRSGKVRLGLGRTWWTGYIK